MKEEKRASSSVSRLRAAATTLSLPSSPHDHQRLSPTLPQLRQSGQTGGCTGCYGQPPGCSGTGCFRFPGAVYPGRCVSPLCNLQSPEYRSISTFIHVVIYSTLGSVEYACTLCVGRIAVYLYVYTSVDYLNIYNILRSSTDI